MAQPDGIHTIPVPLGWSVEQAWEQVTRNLPLTGGVTWANVEVKDGKMVKAHGSSHA